MKKCQCSIFYRLFKQLEVKYRRFLRLIPILALTVCFTISPSVKAVTISSATGDGITAGSATSNESAALPTAKLIPAVMDLVFSEVIAPQLDIVPDLSTEDDTNESDVVEPNIQDTVETVEATVTEPQKTASTTQSSEYVYKDHPEDWPSTWYYYKGEVLNRQLGVVKGPSGKETYYNLPMSGVISIMKNAGYDYTYWVRSDGAKMYGGYIMVAADLRIRPRGTIVKTTLGLGIVCDTGSFVYSDPYQLDIAVNW